ncbi:hypothetical protein [Mesorhizobium sp. L-2-11]|uniref:hypothetical protein n=1 Tax=Mesorhizobium sp. L-2-11 TaxID=2744521 RepID=UPI001925F23E|nr:hypothetical protein [Mesorhizobium sp. L-2-11]BCH17233.1 hypothetical protein MesoLjLa_40840 [Mesorhizobium sp. L-2-11]
MTLSVVVITPQLAFAGADRRYSDVEALRDFKAAKICALDTADGYGLITFAGAGARASKTPFELSDWITHVLRGSGRTLDQSLHAIAKAATEQKLHTYDKGGHAFGFAGFRKGKMCLQIITSQPQLFSMPAKGKAVQLQVPHSLEPFQVININILPSRKALGFLIGSGAKHLTGGTILNLSRQARRANSKEIAGDRWAIMWAYINRLVARRESSVGPEAMCAWRFKGGGGAHIAFAADGSRERNSGSMPSVLHGLPFSDIADSLMAHFATHAAKDSSNPMPEFNQEILDKLMAGVSFEPKTKF